MSLSNNITFLDYNSTTPIDPRVLEVVLPFLKDNFANESSSHQFGQSINEKVQQARKQIAYYCNAEPNELIFTCGSTEAIINIAIKGVAESYSSKAKHIIIVSTEHKAGLDTCKDLEKKDFEVTYLLVQPNGLIDFAEFKKVIRPDNILVSVMYVNNETSINLRIKEIAKLAHEIEVLFMTDATQAVVKMEIDVEDLGIDLLCFSGHKMYAPKVIGALCVRNKTKLTPQIHGGGHEQGLRNGSLNDTGIIALAKACEIVSEGLTLNQRNISVSRDKIETEFLKLPYTSLNGDSENRIFNTNNISSKGKDANVLNGRMKNIAVYNGSACSSVVVEPSHVLKAMGLSDDNVFASLRFLLGKYNSIEDIDTVIHKIKELSQPNFKYA
jgi:cysteine desulfurase